MGALRSRYGRIALFGAAIVLVQLATQLGGKPFFLTQLTMSAYYTLVAAGLSQRRAAHALFALQAVTCAAAIYLVVTWGSE